MNQLDSVIDQLTEIVRPVVTAIERGHPATRGHYDQYMAALERIVGQLTKGERNVQMYLGVALAMKRAGANTQGVHDALRAMGHLDGESV